jgi:hypothetical protein
LLQDPQILWLFWTEYVAWYDQEHQDGRRNNIDWLSAGIESFQPQTAEEERFVDSRAFAAHR